MFGYLAVGFGGFLIGVIATSVLLAKKNLEAMQKIEGEITETIKSSLDAGKVAYQSELNKNSEKE